ncbi:MAG: GNAT family N-acetyltransferase [Nitrososphaerota archaeon]|nr:GNAT family N-acetyltransferase [Nitrososphaerota archaeon]MDG7023436.1 GNAT family N-acetyltransferase [Nitrososphaerota archaeon]
MQKVVVARVGDYQIRRCEREDIQAVININAEALPEHYSDYFYYEILAEFPETFLVADLDGALIGYVMCRIEYGFSHLKRLGLARKGHIVSIAVREQHRGKGVGTMLMRTSQEAMTAKTATESYLEVRVTNSEAIALYQRIGYRVTSRLEAYYKDGEAALVMAAPLGQ